MFVLSSDFKEMDETAKKDKFSPPSYKNRINKSETQNVRQFKDETNKSNKF